MAKGYGLTKDSLTIAEHRFKTEDGKHTLYVQEWGNNKAKPILFLHGGPGAGCDDKHKLAYDPKKHYVIFIDQRGSGNSTPKGSIKNNTTQDLVNDIELVRNKLGIDKFSVHGGSWGSTLALCYAIAHPENVSDMLISGIFTGTKEEFEWFEQVKYRVFFPEIWEMMIEGVPPKYHENIGAYLAKQIQEKNSKRAAYKYTEAEGLALALDDRAKPVDYEEYDMSYAKIISYYVLNREFLPENHILKNAKKLKMPIHIVQGRYDMVCPPISAYRLHKALPNSQLHISLAGHKRTDRSSYDVMQTLIKLVY